MTEKYAKTTSETLFETQNVFGKGAPNTAYARYFTGESFLCPLTRPQDGIALANVTFSPGCRNHWHIHHAAVGGGQILLCTAGEGLYCEDGKQAVRLIPGSVVVIPPHVRHWHGAAPDKWFSHIAFEIPGTDCSTEWCEEVTDEEYRKAAEV